MPFPAQGSKQGGSELQGILLPKLYSELQGSLGNVRPSFKKYKTIGSLSGSGAQRAHLVEDV